MPWYPQTSAPAAERVKILESVSKKHPKAGWKLLLELLPTTHSMVSTNHRPAFQNWALRWSEDATRADYAFQVEACAHLVAERAGNDLGRLKDAIEVFEYLPPSARTELLKRMSNIDPFASKADDRRNLAEALREKVSRHRQFAEASWALAEQVLGELDCVRMRLEPDDVVARNAWLFGDYWKVQWQVKQHGGEEEDADKAVERLRATGLRRFARKRTGMGFWLWRKPPPVRVRSGGARHLRCFGGRRTRSSDVAHRKPKRPGRIRKRLRAGKTMPTGVELGAGTPSR